jgi:cell division protein FtsZ
MRQADQGLAELHATVDTVISIPNDRLVELVPRGTSFYEAFRLADDVLRQGVQGISDIITTPGLINRDFADVRSIMTGMGFAIMGTATAGGENAAVEAARAAILCPLIDEAGLQGARAILVNISASGKLALHDLYEACELIRLASGVEDVQINFGVVPDESLGDQVKVTVIATGFERPGLPEAEAPHVSFSAPAELSAAPAPVAEPEPSPILDIPSANYAGEAEPDVEDGLAFDFADEPEPAASHDAPPDLEPGPVPSTPPSAPSRPVAEPEPIVESDDIFTLDDIDTPPILRRERKSY